MFSNGMFREILLPSSGNLNSSVKYIDRQYTDLDGKFYGPRCRRNAWPVYWTWVWKPFFRKGVEIFSTWLEILNKYMFFWGFFSSQPTFPIYKFLLILLGALIFFSITVAFFPRQKLKQISYLHWIVVSMIGWIHQNTLAGNFYS